MPKPGEHLTQGNTDPKPVPMESAPSGDHVSKLVAASKHQLSAATDTRQERMSDEQFVDSVLLPKLDAEALPAAKLLVREMVHGLREKTFDAAIVRRWSERQHAIIQLMENALYDVHRQSGERCGAAGMLAMVEIAHHTPHLFRWIILKHTNELAKALDHPHAPEAPKHIEKLRSELLKDVNAEQPGDSDTQFLSLLKQYDISRDQFLSAFANAREGIAKAGSFDTFCIDVEHRFIQKISKTLDLKKHPYDIIFDTNLSEDQFSEPTLPRIGMLVEIASELVGNALKVMEGARRKTGTTGTTIRVALNRLPQGDIVLTVRDDGPGGDPDKVFQPGHSTTQAFGGGGMGLGLWKKTIKREFCGALTVVDNKEEEDLPGMTFTCRLSAPKEKAH
jgi:signal transduction histidine kinase